MKFKGLKETQEVTVGKTGIFQTKLAISPTLETVVFGYASTILAQNGRYNFCLGKITSFAWG